MHVNSNNVDHNLTNHDVHDNERTKGQQESIVSHQVFYRFFREEHLLLVYDESIQEDNATS